LGKWGALIEIPEKNIPAWVQDYFLHHLLCFDSQYFINKSGVKMALSGCDNSNLKCSWSVNACLCDSALKS
jgi:hypothetical protein